MAHEKKLRKLPLKFIGAMSFVSHSNSFSATFVINLFSNYNTLTISLLKQIKTLHAESKSIEK